MTQTPTIIKFSDGKFYRLIRNSHGHGGCSYRRCAEDGTIRVPVRVSKKDRIRARRAKAEWESQHPNAFAVSDIGLGKTSHTP